MKRFLLWLVRAHFRKDAPFSHGDRLGRLQEDRRKFPLTNFGGRRIGNDRRLERNWRLRQEMRAAWCDAWIHNEVQHYKEVVFRGAYLRGRGFVEQTITVERLK